MVLINSKTTTTHTNTTTNARLVAVYGAMSRRSVISQTWRSRTVRSRANGPGFVRRYSSAAASSSGWYPRTCTFHKKGARSPILLEKAVRAPPGRRRQHPSGILRACTCPGMQAL